MRIKIREKQYPEPGEWHWWYAWYPVRTSSLELRWLEPVWRKTYEEFVPGHGVLKWHVYKDALS